MEKILKHEKLIITLILLITVFFAFQIPKISINNDMEVFLPEDNPVKVINNEVKDIFGGNQIIIVALKVKSDDIFTIENVSLIDKLTVQFEDTAGVDEVTSLTNADYIDGTAEGMIVEELLEGLPENEEGLTDLKRKLLSWDLYKNNLYSKDFKSTQILIGLKDNLTIDENSQVYFNVKDIINKEITEKNQLEVHIAGVSAVNVLMGNSMIQDIKKLIPFVVFALILFLFIFFRRVYPVVLTMITVLISTIWSVGLMALLGIHMTLITTVIPVLLIAVGSAYGIHILSNYYDDLINERGKLSQESHKDVVLKTVNRMGNPVFLACLTTLVGFGSLSTSRIVPIKDFGIFAAVGIASAFLVAILLIPSLLLIGFKKNRVSRPQNRVEDFLDYFLTKFHKLYSQRKVVILVISIIVIMISLLGMNKIIIDSPLIAMFKETTNVRKADNFINKNFSGTSVMNVMIEGQGRGSLTDPRILQAMDDLGIYLMDNAEEVGKVTSITDFIKRMNSVMHYDEAAGNQETTTADANTDQENNFYSQSNEDTNKDETTNSFYSESGSDSDSEETSSFYNNSADSQIVEDNTSDFYSEADGDSKEEESTSSFYSQAEVSTDITVQENNRNTQGSTDKRPLTNGSINDYEFARILNDALSRADSLDLSGEELIRLVNRELNYQGAAYNEIPYDPDKYPAENREGLKNLISQYLLLYSGSLDNMINDQLEPDKAQMIVQLKDPSNLIAGQIEEKIISYTEEHFPEGYTVKISGYSAMGLEANNLIVHSQTVSILVSFLIVFIIVALSYRSLIAGFFGIIPLAFSLIINFGLMGFSGINLDIGTAMVSSIAIGIGVDYTIHFLAGYYNERLKSADLYQVTSNTLKSSGKAIIFNAVSVAAGFMVLTFSNFYPLIYLGLLITVTMLTSSLAALTILPILLNIFKPAFISKK